LLDYARKDYRDFRIGNFIFDENAQILINRGIRWLVTVSEVPAHTQYLRWLGLRKAAMVFSARTLANKNS